MIAGDERLLVGRFLTAGAVLKPDEIEQRIEILLSSWLVHLADDPVTGAWRRLYKDPSDGRLWELTFPQGEIHGGGPRCLKAIAPYEATNTFGGQYEV